MLLEIILLTYDLIQVLSHIIQLQHQNQHKTEGWETMLEYKDTSSENWRIEIYKIKYSKLKYNRRHHVKKKKTMHIQRCNIGLEKAFPVATLDRKPITLMKVIRE